MRNESNTSAGIGAPSLLMVLVVLSLGILSALTVMNARSEQRLSERSTAVSSAVYALYAEAEETVATLDTIAAECEAKAATEQEYMSLFQEILPGDVTFRENMVYFTVTDGVRSVECTLQAVYGDEQRLIWKSRRLSAVTEEEWSY